MAEAQKTRVAVNGYGVIGERVAAASCVRTTVERAWMTLRVTNRLNDSRWISVGKSKVVYDVSKW